MSYVRVVGRASRSFCFFLFSVAVFALWASLAAGAGFILLQLPDVWASHSNDDNSRYAIMSITAYALIVGVLFLVFAANAIARLSDAVTATRVALRHLCGLRAVRLMRRHEPVSAVALQAVRHTP